MERTGQNLTMFLLKAVYVLLASILCLLTYVTLTTSKPAFRFSSNAEYATENVVRLAE